MVMQGSHDFLEPWRDLPWDAVFTGYRPPYVAPQLAELSIHPDALRAIYGRATILPIESLKWDAMHWLKRFEGHPARVFLSSGTSRGDQSVSPFSEEGLALYREFSLKTFWAVLRHFFNCPQKVQGWSLVPPPEQWPQSSLAQMVAWIAEEGTVSYPSDRPQPPEAPIWLFATAFHLVQWADSGHLCPLPEGSVIIETGGTKGKSRSVSREELYTLIEQVFSVPHSHVISEYGMCEMASQAYDFVVPGQAEPRDLTQRTFRFPAWVQPQCVDASAQTQHQGVGSLMVDDPLRIDLPWPLRTEDMVDLQSDGSFRLLGRVPYAPLKGCSLLAEDCLVEYKSIPLLSSKVTAFQSPAQLDQRVTRAIEMWANFLADQRLERLFVEHLGSPRLASALLQDLKRSLPPTPQAWTEAARRAVDIRSPQRWLIIAPRTHAVAPMHSLAMAAILGLRISLRCTSGLEIFKLWQEHFAPLTEISLLPPDYRLGQDPWPEVDAAMIYGSSETIQELRTLCPWPIQGFGSHLTAALLHVSELKDGASLLWKDVLSLGQKGCMSVRVAFLWGADTKLEQADLPALDLASLLYTDALSLPDSLSLVHASYQWQREGRHLRPRQHPKQPLVIFEAWDSKRDLASMLCDRPWALPVMQIPSGEEEAFRMWLHEQVDLQKLSLSEKSQLRFANEGQQICKLGEANAPLWDGLHQGRPLFSLTNQEPG